MNPYRSWQDLQAIIQNSRANPVLRCYQNLTKKFGCSLKYGQQTSPIFLGCIVLFMITFCLPTAAYIEGPWLWMIASGADINSDQLAAVSKGQVAENIVAEYGVNEGDIVGGLRWTRGRILSEVDCLLWQWVCYSNNVNKTINRIGLSNNRGLNYHSAYALINIVSPRDRRNVAMGVGSDDAVKIWFNGKVVHVHDVSRGTTDVQDLFRVNLKAGDNLLMVKVSNNLWNWGMFFDIYLEKGEFRTAIPTATSDISLAVYLFEKYRALLQQPEIRKRVPTVLAHLQKPDIQALLTPVTIDAVVKNPDLLGTFGVSDEVIQFLKAHPGIRAMFSDPDFQTLLQNPAAFSEFAGLITDDSHVKISERQQQQPGDVDGNGVVNIQDLVFIAARFGKKGSNAADVNGDKTVDIRDLVLAAAAMHSDATAPSAYVVTGTNPDNRSLRPENIQLWLTQAQRLDLNNATLRRGVRTLGHLMEMLTPKRTNLLPNYPNPFNPETWIPYQLAESADVRLTIYAADGRLIRTLALGHQSAGIYHSKSRAAYWDGRNALGEPVASGVYFYTLRVSGEFTATRKMLIRK